MEISIQKSLKLVEKSEEFKFKKSNYNWKWWRQVVIWRKLLTHSLYGGHWNSEMRKKCQKTLAIKQDIKIVETNKETSQSNQFNETFNWRLCYLKIKDHWKCEKVLYSQYAIIELWKPYVFDMNC